ncbi:MAG: M1 family metallopeptidase [Bacteroidota bacterium]
MSRRFSSFLEFGFILAATLGLVAFIGPPQTGRQRGPVVTPPSSTQLSEASALAPWDRNLILPRQSDRISNYMMDVRLNPETRIISGWEILEWRNTTGRSQSEFPFHLYHNAWKNNRSTFAKENGWNLGRAGMAEGDYGYINVKRVVLLDPRGEIDITHTFKYIQPDDGNPDDQTVFQIATPRSVPAGGVLRLRIDFETKQPLPITRTGAIRDYHFVAQWFPKIGVWWNGAWNCHQFHANTEFFSNYGVYDVKITLPSQYVIGATGGLPKEKRENSDQSTTYRFYQEDVHDFAWVTSPGLVRNVRTFVHDARDDGERLDRHHSLREVEVILLTQPHHDNLIERYFDATFKSLRYYGEWYGEYPYEAVTVVDPANDSQSGGMEYPTLFTGGGNMFAPKETASPEGVTVHEFGHQFWYGLVGNNEFEEAWLDEGFNSYSQDRVMQVGWPPFKNSRYFFGGSGAGTNVGIPCVYHEFDQSRHTSGNLELRNQGKNDVMTRKGWEYYQSYGLNSYTKPAMSLWQLENFVGEEMMYRIMRTYHHRYRFKHPTSQDFINTVNEVTGQNMNWFFQNTWFSSDLFDYAVSQITNRRLPSAVGIFSTNGNPAERPADPALPYECSVVVTRKGEAVAPVEVLVVFENGDKREEVWDGQDRWKKFVYQSDSPVRHAIVDPKLKLVMDIDYLNNSRVSRPPGFRSLAARKIGIRAMFWVQSSLEIETYWH